MWNCEDELTGRLPKKIQHWAKIVPKWDQAPPETPFAQREGANKVRNKDKEHMDIDTKRVQNKAKRDANIYQQTVLNISQHHIEHNDCQVPLKCKKQTWLEGIRLPRFCTVGARAKKFIQ